MSDREQAIRAGWAEFWGPVGGRWTYNWTAHNNRMVLIVGAPAGLEPQERVTGYGVSAYRHPCGCVTCEGITLASNVPAEPFDRDTLLALIAAADGPEGVLEILDMAGALR